MAPSINLPYPLYAASVAGSSLVTTERFLRPSLSSFTALEHRVKLEKAGSTERFIDSVAEDSILLALEN